MPDPQRIALEPWAVVERGVDVRALAHAETVLALSNGHIGLRGNLDEGEPAGVPGTYLNGFYETRPLPYAEAGYGDPEDGQTAINVTNGKLLRLLVDDEPLDIRYGELLRHERRLDLRAGELVRDVEWRSPAGQGLRLRSTRLVSFAQRSVAAIELDVEPVGDDARIVVQSELVANEPGEAPNGDPRAAAALRAPLIAEHHDHRGLRATLVHRTRSSGLRVAAGVDHVVEGPAGTVCDVESEPELARVTVTTELRPGQRLRVVKLLAYGWSSRRSVASLRDQVAAALAAARRTGWAGLRRAQREYLDEFWSGADVELDGDATLQHALRFALFQVLQAAARAERRAIPAKGLTGRGYDGHTFWDTEMYTLPVLSYVAPTAARDALLWRHSTLDLAEARARELGLRGATFPWRTIRGHECSGYWPASTAAFHVNAAVAEAVRRYTVVAGDEGFAAGPGLALLVATARMWCAVGHHDRAGRFRIDGVTGPDEYSALADNNAYTNLMAARNLRVAADFAARHRDRAGELGVDDDEIAAWRRAADAIVVPFDDELGVTAQADGYTRLRNWDFDAAEAYPLLLHRPYYLLYSSQVVKQADLVMALYVCGRHFSHAQKARDFAYYERITVRDSSLSAPMQAIVAAEVGQLDLALAYLAETALIDLRDLAGNTRDGVHLAAMAGAWLVVAAGFGGLRDDGDALAFAPRLPERIERLRFRLAYRGRRLSVEVRHGQATYEVVEGPPLTIRHHGRPLDLPARRRVSAPVPPASHVPAAAQPPGRPPRLA